MESSKKKSYAEMWLVILGALYLCYHGFALVLHTLASTMDAQLDSAYAVGKLLGELTGAAFPLIVGVGLLLIVYSRRCAGMQSSVGQRSGQTHGSGYQNGK